MFALSFMRHMHDFGTTPEQVAHVKVFHSWGASNNPKAYYDQRVTPDDVVNSRPIVYPLHLLDCCVETDNATCLIVTSAERRRDLRQVPARIQSVVGRCLKPRGDHHLQHGPITRVAGYYREGPPLAQRRPRPRGRRRHGIVRRLHLHTLLQLEDYGFCEKGDGGRYVSDGTIGLGGRRPNNTAGGHLNEGYTHGISMVIENVRQLRHEVGRLLSVDEQGRKQHTYDYSPGRLPSGARRRDHREPRLGHACARIGARDEEGMMPLQGDFLGMELVVLDDDAPNLAFFGHCGEGELRLQRWKSNGLLSYPPTHANPWDGTPEHTWEPVDGRGTVLSYNQVMHAINPAFREATPYLTLLVEPRRAAGRADRARGAAHRRQPGRPRRRDGRRPARRASGHRLAHAHRAERIGDGLRHAALDARRGCRAAHPWRYPAG